jgi:hypothetical protein
MAGVHRSFGGKSEYPNEGRGPAGRPVLAAAERWLRGLENQLYRIEAHDGGTRDSATFKWSRENASVSSRIENFVGGNIIRVASLGRDELLGFKVGDWVEVTDNRRELDGHAGDMTRITAINPDSREITLADDLSEDLVQNGDTAGRRVLRWDQGGSVRDADGNEIIDLDSEDSAGVIPIPDDPDIWVQLEHGIEVSFAFAPVNGRVRSGDFWLVPARTASASIEPLNEAPPRGIHHHYCKLAIVTWSENPNVPPRVLDCRTLWPPDFGGDNCACTVCVTAESHNNGLLTIQQAIDRVVATGGTVCLGPGNFFLGERPISIAAAQSLTLRGQGPRTALFYPGQDDDPPPAISVEDSWAVEITNLSMVTSGSRITSAIRVRTSAGVVIKECLFLQVPPREQSVLPLISIGGAVVELSIRDNSFFGGIAIAAVPGPGDTVGSAPQVAIAGLYICHNHLFCDLWGIGLEAFVLLLGETDLSDNFVHGTRSAGIRVMGTAGEGAPVNISRNTILVDGDGDGIVIATDNATVTYNNVTAVNPGQGRNGIVLAEASGNEDGIDSFLGLGNRITNLGGAGIDIGTRVRSATIKLNIVDSVSGGGILMGADSSAVDLMVSENQIRNVASLNPETDETLAGIRIVNANSASVVGNMVNGVAVEANGSPSRAGIQVIASRDSRISGNEVVNIGPAGTGGPGVVQIGGVAIGIDVFGPFDRVDATENIVKRSQVTPSNADPTSWSAVRIRPPGNQFQLTDRLTLLPADDAGNTLRITNAVLIMLPRGREIAAILRNLLGSHDSTASLVSVRGQGTCIFTDNRCIASFGGFADFVPAEVSVNLTVGGAIASNNYVEAPQATIPIRLNPPSGAQNFFTVVGNITSGPIRIGDAALSPPWAELNVGAL